MTRPGFVTWAGLAVVLTAAAALSFNSLRLLAIACHISPELAPGLPICVDAGAAVATRAWLSGRTGPVAEQYARRMTWCLLLLTVTGNATHQLMAAERVPAWLLVVTVIVGAVPAGVMGAAVHLAVLLGREDAGRQTGAGASDPPTPEAAGSSPGAPPRSAIPNAPVKPEAPSTRVESTPVKVRPKRTSMPEGSDTLISKTRELLPIGRVALAKKLDINEYQARELLKAAKTTNGSKVLEDVR